MAKQLEWVYAAETAGGVWTTGKYRVLVAADGRFYVRSENFPTLADAKAWCQSQEDAAAPPAELPPLGSVWGVPGKPETWRKVIAVNAGTSVRYGCFAHGTYLHAMEDWNHWVTSSGAVRIDGEGERVAELEAEVAASQNQAIRYRSKWEESEQERDELRTKCDNLITRKGRGEVVKNDELAAIISRSEHAAFEECQKVEEGDFLKLTGSIMFHVQMIDHRHRRPLDYFDVVYARRCIETPNGVEYLGSTEKLTVTYDPPNNPVVRIERRARIICGAKKEEGGQG